MTVVESLDEYKSMIAAEKARFGRITKNAVQMPSAMEPYILAKRLYARKFPEGTIFLLDEGRYYTAYYYLDAGKAFPEISEDRPVIVEEIGVTGKKEEEMEEKEQRLLAAGFTRHRNNLLVERTAALPCPVPSPAPGYRLVYSDGGEFDEALSLWDRFLDPEDVPMDHRSLKSGDKLCFIRDDKGTACAVYWWNISGRRSEGRHVVTEPSHLRKGLGSALLSEWICDAAKSGCELFTTWISDRNTPSLALYGSLGFVDTGKYCRQYKKI